MAPNDKEEIKEVPPDNPEASPSANEEKRRKTIVMDGSDGDICVMQAIGANHETYPEGTLLPIAAAPRFRTGAAAKKWVMNDSGDVLAGIQFVIIHVKEIGHPKVEHKPVVTVSWKPKRFAE